tara:strand:- start:2451 stop:3158 length:708 start_codon:yes stop_codon:yes gene_type:complete
MKQITPVLLLATALTSSAATIEIFNTGSSDLQSVGIRDGFSNQGAAEYSIVGQTTTSGDLLRGLLTFDLSDPLLAGATINSVTLTLTVGKDDPTSTNGDVTLNLFELTTPYVYDEATWVKATDTTDWTTEGGDYSTLLASEDANPGTAPGGTEIDFTGSALDSYVQSSIGETIYLLTKLDVENNATRDIFFFVREGNSARPTLAIDYTPVPEPSSFALIAGFACLGGLALRRSRS